MFLWSVRDGWRDIYSERGLLLPISSSRSQGVPTLAPPCKLVRDACDRLRVPRSTAIFCHCLNLTAWFSSRDLLPVTHLLYPSALMCCLIRDRLSKYSRSLGTNWKSVICYITKVIKFIKDAMKNWRVEVAAVEKILAEVKIQRGMLQGDELSSLLFVIEMMPLNHKIRKCTGE